MPSDRANRSDELFIIFWVLIPIFMIIQNHITDVSEEKQLCKYLQRGLKVQPSVLSIGMYLVSKKKKCDKK